MTGLDTETLREALRAGNDHGGAVDVALIMDRGRRLRRRRRATAVAGTLCALALLAGAGTGLADLASSPPAPAAPVSPVRPAPHGPRLPARGTATPGRATPGPGRDGHADPDRSRSDRGGPRRLAHHRPVGQASHRPPLAVVIALTGTPGSSGKHRGPCGQHGSRDVNDMSGSRASAPSR